MTLLEKIKINIDYLLGKADSSLYESPKNQNLSSEDWINRWKAFSDDGNGFVWYGVDAEGNLAEFVCDEAYIPEAFFQNPRLNRQIQNFFDNLPEITTTELPENLRAELKELAERRAGINKFWTSGANKGLFVFSETDAPEWDKIQIFSFIKKPYELYLIPTEPLNVKQLPEEIQNLLEPFHFKDLRFRNCQFLDISKYFYCEE